MRAFEKLLVGLGLVALLLATVFAVRVARRSDVSAELGRIKLSALEPTTRERLAELQDDVLVTYYVTARADMPSHLRRLENSVTDVLEAFAGASQSRLSYQLVDPSLRPDLIGYAAGQRVAPFHVRSVQHDAYSEAKIYSTLTIAYGIHPPALIHGVLPEHLPRLQRMLIEHLDRMESPRTPVFGLAGKPERFTELAADLAASGELREVDMGLDQAVDAEVDLLFWMDPGPIDEVQLRRLRQFLDDGGSVVVMGSTHEAELDATGSVRLRPSDYDAATLQGAFGLRPESRLVLDGRCELAPVGDETLPAPFRIHCIAPNQDFHTLVGQPNGHLFFRTPSPVLIDGDLPMQLGWRPEVLATTSEQTWRLPVPAGPVALADLNVAPGAPIQLGRERAPKLPLLTLLRPVDPWRGSILFGASSSPLRDGTYANEGSAHRGLVRVLTRTLASAERMVTRRAGIARTEPLPPLSPGARSGWRVFCLLLVPVALVLLAIQRGVFRRAPRAPRAPGSSRQASGLRLWLTPLVVVVLVLTSAVGIGRAGWRVDATEDGLNRLAPETEELARRSGESAPLEVELFLSAPANLPPNMRPGVRSLRNLLRDVDRAGARVKLRSIDPSDLDDADRAALLDAGIEPFRAHSTDDEITTVRTVWSSLRLRWGERETQLSFRGAESFEQLELRLAFALWRLIEGRVPHVAFASDLPRLSPAEAHEDYQLKGRFAPTGTDVYSSARAALSALDLRVTHVDPQRPEIPADADLLIWIQPRRDVTVMLEKSVEFLRSGRPLALFAQHFNIQPRQYPGAGFDTVYWPQPQSPDIERIYWPELGIGLVRDVLFDERNFPLSIETQVNRDADERDYDEQHSALPFLVRAVGSNFSQESNITRGLGDLGFVWGSRLEFDDALLAQQGLSAQPLITTTERSWSYPWSGGWLPPAALEGPVNEDGERLEDGAGYLGRVPLAAIVEGHFPRYLAPDAATGEVPDRGPATAGEASKLLLVGNSEMLKNTRLFDPELRADHLLTNAAFELAVGNELSAIASRRRVARGFDWVEDEARLRWRAIVVGAVPLALLLLGALRWRLRG